MHKSDAIGLAIGGVLGGLITFFYETRARYCPEGPAGACQVTHGHASVGGIAIGVAVGAAIAWAGVRLANRIINRLLDQ